MITKIKNFILFLMTYIMSFFPTALPKGMVEFDEYFDRLFRLIDSRIPKNDSTRFALASMMLHLGSTEHRKPLRYFMKVLEKGATAQVAVGVMEALKAAQKLRDEAAKAEAAIQAKLEAEKKAIEEVQGSQPITQGGSDGPVQQPQIQARTSEVVQPTQA